MRRRRKGKGKQGNADVCLCGKSHVFWALSRPIATLELRAHRIIHDDSFSCRQSIGQHAHPSFKSRSTRTVNHSASSQRLQRTIPESPPLGSPPPLSGTSQTEQIRQRSAHSVVKSALCRVGDIAPRLASRAPGRRNPRWRLAGVESQLQQDYVTARTLEQLLSGTQPKRRAGAGCRGQLERRVLGLVHHDIPSRRSTHAPRILRGIWSCDGLCESGSTAGEG